jgi:nitrate/nitrite transporter NarK
MLPWFSGSPAISVALLALTSAGHYAALAVFWTIPSDYLSRSEAAGGIAMVSTIGALGGAIAPILLGSVKTMTGNLHYGLYVIAGMAALGSIILLVGIAAPTTDVRRRLDSV